MVILLREIGKKMKAYVNTIFFFTLGFGFLIFTPQSWAVMSKGGQNTPIKAQILSRPTQQKALDINASLLRPRPTQKELQQEHPLIRKGVEIIK
jgi:hypothetical protein